MSPTDEQQLYLTGDATHGWNFDAPVTTLYWTGHEIYSGQVTFIQDKYFRCFKQKDWGPDSFGHNVLTNYDTDVIIIAVGHGDPNWQFIAASGTYDVVVDMRKESITITPVP